MKQIIILIATTIIEGDLRQGPPGHIMGSAKLLADAHETEDTTTRDTVVGASRRPGCDLLWAGQRSLPSKVFVGAPKEVHSRTGSNSPEFSYRMMLIRGKHLLHFLLISNLSNLPL